MLSNTRPTKTQLLIFNPGANNPIFIFAISGVARGTSGGTRSGVQALEAHQYAFCSHLKTRLSRNLYQSML